MGGLASLCSLSFPTCKLGARVTFCSVLKSQGCMGKHLPHQVPWGGRNRRAGPRGLSWPCGDECPDQLLQALRLPPLGLYSVFKL